MTNQRGRAIWYWILAAGLLIAGFLIAAEPAHAHGDGASHAVAELDEPDPEHVEKGHPGHCHGGTFCNGVAMFSVVLMAPEPFSNFDRQAIPKGGFRLLAVTSFDPPPPRVLF